MLKISKLHLKETLDSLKSSPSKEKVLLWFGENNGEESIVKEVFEPVQFTDWNYFEIPKNGIQEIIDKVKKDKWIVIAQIHTHPGSAFHSLVDDRMAIPRHKGAYSLVLPKFASKTKVVNFLNQVAVYELSGANIWIKVSNNNIVVYE